MSKLRHSRPLDRTEPTNRDARLIIIATEGEKTERQYFAMFRSKRVQVRVLPTSEGRSSPSAVMDRLSAYESEYALGEDDELWLAVDTDRWEVDMLGDVARLALQKKYKLAVSNPCFELWLLLHHKDVDPQESLTCTKVVKRLRDALGSYNKANLNQDHFKPHGNNAVARAKALDTSPDERWPRDVGTHVYRVVESILKLLDSKAT